MSETTSNTADKATDILLQMVNITVKTMGDVVEFGKQQIPEVVNQLIVWNAVQSGLWMVLGIVIAIFLIAIGNNRKEPLNDAETGLGTFIQVVCWVIGLVVGGIMLFDNLLELIKILVAPKVWLIEYAAHLVRGVN